MNSSEKGIRKEKNGKPRGTTDVKSVNTDSEFHSGKETRYPKGCDARILKREASREGGEGHGESHRPRVRIGESQKPVREEIGGSQ